MIEETCEACGATFSGEDRDTLGAAALDHFTTAHPEWGVGETAIDNWLDARERLSDKTERLDAIGHIEVHQVTPDRIDDVLRFFDYDGFAGNPEWASCYCMFFHLDDPKSFGNAPWQKNREGLTESLRQGTTTGYLAYVDGNPAGWCNASLRSAYPIRRQGVDDDEVGVVACFVIAPSYRRHGLARRLLDAAIEGFRTRGVKRVQAHPRIGTDDDRPNFHGPLSLYLGAGFEIVEQNERDALVVKDLQPTGAGR